MKLYPRLWRLLRQHRPAIVHTRNLAALEMQVPAWAARVPVRIHGEHGRDVDDLDGTSRHYQRVRRLYSPFVHRYVALSRDLAGYLQGPVGIAPGRIEQIYNGVDAERFAPPPGGRRAASPAAPSRRRHIGSSAPSAACRPSSTRRCWRAPSCARSSCTRAARARCAW